MKAIADGAPPALVLDAALRQSLVTIRALGRAGVRVVAAETHGDVPAFSSRWCSESRVLPDFARDETAFVDAVIELAEELGRPVIISSHDGAIEALRARREELEAVAALALPSEAALTTAVDKRSTLAVAGRLGISVPPGEEVSDASRIDEALARLGMPIVVKPAISWIAAGDAAPWRAAPSVARTRTEALEQITSLLDGGAHALVQQWLPGAREAVSVFMTEGQMWAVFAQRADRMYPLIGGSSVARHSIPVPSDEGRVSEELMRELWLEGYAEIEFRRDRGGRPFLMEINPRLSASVEIAVRSGVDFPLLIYRWKAGLGLQPVERYRYGRRMRWLKGDVEWLKEAIRDPGNPDAPPRFAAARTFLFDFARPSGYDYWDVGDVGPAAAVASRAVRALPGRVTRFVAKPR